MTALAWFARAYRVNSAPTLHGPFDSPKLADEAAEAAFGRDRSVTSWSIERDDAATRLGWAMADFTQDFLDYGDDNSDAALVIALSLPQSATTTVLSAAALREVTG